MRLCFIKLLHICTVGALSTVIESFPLQRIEHSAQHPEEASAAVSPLSRLPKPSMIHLNASQLFLSENVKELIPEKCRVDTVELFSRPFPMEDCLKYDILDRCTVSGYKENGTLWKADICLPITCTHHLSSLDSALSLVDVTSQCVRPNVLSWTVIAQYIMIGVLSGLCLYISIALFIQFLNLKRHRSGARPTPISYCSYAVDYPESVTTTAASTLQRDVECNTNMNMSTFKGVPSRTFVGPPRRVERSQSEGSLLVTQANEDASYSDILRKVEREMASRPVSMSQLRAMNSNSLICWNV